MKLLLRVTFKDMLVANSIGISLAQKLSRGDRSAFVLARWCKLGGAIDTSGSDLGARSH